MPNLIDGYLQILLDVIGDSPIVRSFEAIFTSWMAPGSTSAN
jgi:hypothetical protein